MKTTTAQEAARQPTSPDLAQHNRIQATDADDAPLSVSALICTRNRGDSIVAAVRSILACSYPDMELIIIDQSTNDETMKALAPFLSDTRLRCVRSNTQGKGTALNLGLREAQNEIVAITDDDCKVEADWLASHTAAFQKYPDVAVTYGSVIAASYDESEGFTPVYVVKQDSLCRNVFQKLVARGIGANMAIRRSVALELQGFDEELGPGGTFHSCEEGDFSVRCLLRGYHVFETSKSAVLHYGFRTWDEGRQLTRDSFYGMGAAYIKPIKCGRLSVLPLLTYEFVRYALFPSLWATVTFRKPTNWQRVISFLRGVGQGWTAPVNRATILYVPKSNAQRV